MPRSSKHKSSKHSSRDTREYSNSEKDIILKDQKERDESVVKVKDSSSIEKRKLDSKDGKDLNGYGNGEYSEEYASLKRRKERSNDGVSDRWNGGDEDRAEGSRKSKTSGDSKSRRDESFGVYGEGEELKKSSSKSDGKHKNSRRKESREGGTEKGRKFKEGRSEGSVDNEEQRMSKQVFENTDLRGLEELQCLEPDNQLEKQMRKKRDDYGNDVRRQDDVGDGYDRCLSSRDDNTKDGKQKDDKRKDEKCRDKYREEMDRENKYRHDKEQDERSVKNNTGNRSDDKHAQEVKDNTDSRRKRTKLLESDRYHNHDRDEDQDLESSHGHEQSDRAYDRRHDNYLDKDWSHNRDQNWDRDLDRDPDQDRDTDCHVSDAVEQSARSKESRAKKRNLDDRDKHNDTNSQVLKIHYSDAEKRSSNRVDSDANRGGSQSQQTDSIGTNLKRRSSPSADTCIGKGEHRNVNSDDLKFRDSIMDVELRTKGLKEALSGMSERGSGYKSTEKPTKIYDDPVGDLSNERSSSSNASPMGLVERSPSSTNIECKYVNRSGIKQNLEIEESGQRNSINARDFFASEDRLGRELPLEKPLLDEFSHADSSFNGRTSQGSASFIPPSPFRAGLDRSFMGSLENDVRDNSNPRYRRNNNPGFGRGHGNSWRGVPNWTLPVPNGFVPFQHGPTHGGFQAMIPQFPSQPLFGVRPPMEVNHAGIPYHIPDADRFSGHIRPLGWQNMMEGTCPSHFHGWDGNNGLFRDDPHVYCGSDWDRNRHGWEAGSETWKEQNGDLKDSSCKDESVPLLVEEGLTEPASHISQDEYNFGGVPPKAPETKSSSFSCPEKVPVKSSPTIMPEKVPEASTLSCNTSLCCRNYLSKLDISAELALPELYHQFIRLLDVEKNACIDSDASTDRFLKNGSRARQKYATTLLKHLPFSVTDCSIFQRAIKHYKKQRLKLLNGAKLDITSASNQLRVDERVPTPNLENKEVTVSAYDALANMSISTSDLKKVETISPPGKEHLEEPHQNLSQRGRNYVCAHAVKLVISGPSSDNRESLATGLGEKGDKVTIKRVITCDVEENQNTVANNESTLESAMHKSGDNMNSKAKITVSAHCADKNLGFGDTLGGPLIFQGGTPKVCDTPSESESLILSRIRHSPESTH